MQEKTQRILREFCTTCEEKRKEVTRKIKETLERLKEEQERKQYKQ